MSFRFFIKDSGGTFEQVSDPVNWESFTEQISIDEDLRLATLNYEISPTFNLLAYRIIKDEYDLNGFCADITLKMEKMCKGGTAWVKFLEAKIFISECKFNFPECTVDCQVRDVSWQSQINNNKKDEVVVTAEVTKNGEVMTGATDLQIELFNPNTGVYATGYQAFDVKEVLELLVNFMTDNTVTFESTWYDNLASDEKLCIMVGKVIRDATLTPVEAPTVSFQGIFEELNRQYNLFVIGEPLSATPTIRIEDEDYVRGSASGITIEEVRESNLTIDVQKLFSNVKLGSQTFLKNEGSSVANVSLPYIITNTFVVEDYQLEGVCNIDKTLDLTNKYITDHNSIEDAIRNGNDDNDDDIYLIQYTPGTPNQATKTYYIGNTSGTPTFYNKVLRNSEALNRWSLPTNVVKYVGNEDDSCIVRRNTSAANLGITTIEPLEYQVEVSDVGANFNNTAVGVDAYGYTAPENGNYTFFFSISMINIVYGAAPTNETVTINLRRYDAAGVLLDTLVSNPVDVYDNTVPALSDPIFILTFPSGGTIDLDSIVGDGTDDVQFRSNFFNVYLDATDFVVVQWNYTPSAVFTMTYDVGSSRTDEGADLFICTAPNSGGGTIDENDPADYIVNQYAFNRDLSDDDWDTLRNDPTQSLTFRVDDPTPFAISQAVPVPLSPLKTGFIDSIERNLKTGETTFNLKTRL